MKYINTKAVGPIIFSAHRDHSEVARALKLKPEDILSAGHFFCYTEGGAVRGGSMTLNTPEVPEDAELLKSILNP